MSKQIPVRVDRDQYEQLILIHEKDGLPIAEQVRRAVREWLKRRNKEQPRPPRYDEIFRAGMEVLDLEDTLPPLGKEERPKTQ